MMIFTNKMEGKIKLRWIHMMCMLTQFNSRHQVHKGPSWSLSYRSWIYNYIVPVQSVPITTKVLEFEPRSWRAVLCDFLRVLWFPPSIKLTVTI